MNWLVLAGMLLIGFLAWSYTMQVILVRQQTLLSSDYRWAVCFGTAAQGVFVISIVAALTMSL